MTLDSVGLITFWNKQFYPPPERCLKWRPPVKLTRLSMKGLSGVFLVLGAGYVLSIISFIMELIIKSNLLKRMHTLSTLIKY